MRGDVAGRDLPASLGEPDRIAALAGADVEGAAWRKVADLVQERPVRVATPHRRVAAVAVVPVGFVTRGADGSQQIFVGQAERDRGADAAAVCRRGEHLHAGVGHVARCVQAGNGGLTHRVDLHDVAHAGDVRDRREAGSGEHVGPGAEPMVDDHGVGVEAPAVGQLDAGDPAVVSGDDAAHRRPYDLRTARGQRVEGAVVEPGRVVQNDGVAIGEVPEERRSVQSHRLGDDLHDTLVAHLEAVTERAADHVTTPVLGQPVDARKLVGQARRHEDAAGDEGVATADLDPEPAVVEPGNRPHPTSEDLTAEAAHLGAATGSQLRRWCTLEAEVAVHVGGRRVPRRAVVHHHHRSALPGELQGGGQPGGRPADDRHVAVAFHRSLFVRSVFVLGHGVDDTVHLQNSKRPCDIRKEGPEVRNGRSSQHRRRRAHAVAQPAHDPRVLAR